MLNRLLFVEVKAKGLLLSSIIFACYLSTMVIGHMSMKYLRLLRLSAQNSTATSIFVDITYIRVVAFEFSLSDMSIVHVKKQLVFSFLNLPK